MKPYDLTVKEASSAIAQGKLSCAGLVRSCLERIDAVEDKIQAWALVDREGALEAANLRDQELRQRQWRGPLHGIPLGIKDIFYTAGLRTEAGSQSWSGFVPQYDAAAVNRLKEAGAIIMGKTRTTEFAYLDPAPTRNPWNTEHTPGGSSSGSAAAVSSGMCLASLGSQTVGSTLRPAAYNGLVGFKAQYGRISTYGVVPLSWSLDHVGILARTVEDTALVFQSIAGYDPRDPNSLDKPVPDCLGFLGRRRAPRIGLLRQFFFDNADEEMRSHVETVVEHLRQAGAQINEIRLPDDFTTINDVGNIIIAVEASAYHEDMFSERKAQYGPRIRKLVEYGLTIPATRYARALRERPRLSTIMGQLLDQVDAFLTPGATGTAPRDLTTTGSAVMQGPWSVTGLPAISLPTGLGRNGLPLAVQLVGPALEENQLVAVARWCERKLAVHLRPP